MELRGEAEPSHSTVRNTSWTVLTQTGLGHGACDKTVTDQAAVLHVGNTAVSSAPYAHTEYGKLSFEWTGPEGMKVILDPGFKIMWMKNFSDC